MKEERKEGREERKEGREERRQRGDQESLDPYRYSSEVKGKNSKGEE